MKRFVVCVLAGMLSVAALADAALAEVKKGESMVVASGNAPLMRGWSTLARLPAGQRFDVLRTEGNWVGARTTVNGRALSGWLWRGQVATPGQFAQRQTTRRYSYQPGTSVRRYSAMPGGAMYGRGFGGGYGGYYGGGMRYGSSFTMGATPYGPSYWRADRKIAGY